MRSRLTFFVALYLLAALTLTAASALLNQQLAVQTGLIRSFYPQVGFHGQPLFRDTTPDISLAFLEEQPQLPRRFFSVRWHGFWFIPREQTIEVYAGGDDHVVVVVDGEPVLRRNASEGMHTSSRTLTLGRGPHQLTVDYEQFGGGFSMKMSYCSKRFS